MERTALELKDARQGLVDAVRGVEKVTWGEGLETTFQLGFGDPSGSPLLNSIGSVDRLYALDDEELEKIADLLIILAPSGDAPLGELGEFRFL